MGDLVICVDEFVLDVFSIGHFLIIFFAKLGVIRLGSGYLSVMLIDDAVHLLNFGAEGCPRVPRIRAISSGQASSRACSRRGGRELSSPALPPCTKCMMYWVQRSHPVS